MLRNWIRVDRLAGDLSPHLGPAPASSGQSLHQPTPASRSLDGRAIKASQPTWLTPAYLRQQRSGDRISRIR